MGRRQSSYRGEEDEETRRDGGKGDSCTCCVASFADMTPAVLCGIADGQEGQALV